MEDTVKVNSAQEFFDIMDGVAAKRKLYPEVIKEYLKTKDIKPFYMVEYDDPMYDEPVKILRRLTDENIADIETLVDAYIEKEYPEELANGGKEDKAWRKDIMPEVAESNDYFVDKEYLHSENLMFHQMNVTNIDIYEKLGLTAIYVTFNDNETFKKSMTIVGTVLGKEELAVAEKYNKYFSLFL